MKKATANIIFILFLFHSNLVFADVISGKVKEDVRQEAKSQIINSRTGNGIEGAKVSLPKENYSTYTDKEGYFTLDAEINKKTILSVDKEGFRPFSITIDKNISSDPIKLGIEETKNSDIILNNSLVHLGDDMYSETSANSYEFRTKSKGPFWSKTVEIMRPKQGEYAILVIGSVIGLDTKMAKTLGQNRINSVYSSPAEIIFNGRKIGELNINGDNQEIELPNSLIGNKNEITIKTGKNLFQRDFTDYDDMEFMNVRIEYKNKSLFANY